MRSAVWVGHAWKPPFSAWKPHTRSRNERGILRRTTSRLFTSAFLPAEIGPTQPDDNDAMFRAGGKYAARLVFLMMLVRAIQMKQEAMYAVRAAQINPFETFDTAVVEAGYAAVNKKLKEQLETCRNLNPLGEGSEPRNESADLCSTNREQEMVPPYFATHPREGMYVSSQVSRSQL